MGYISAIEAAGAVVHDHMRTGDWQGTFIAFVTYGSNTGIVRMEFGSCSHCDPYERLLSDRWDEVNTPVDGVDGVDVSYDLTDEEEAEFGKPYLAHVEYICDVIIAYKKMAEHDVDMDAVVAKLREWAAWEWDMRVDWYDPEWEEEKQRGGYRLYPDV
jgi:hypothetical protein